MIFIERALEILKGFSLLFLVSFEQTPKRAHDGFDTGGFDTLFERFRITI